MLLALTELRRARLRYGLLAGAVALLVFLVLFLSTLSSALLGSFTGAVDGLSADVLVYAAGARDNPAASRLDRSVVARVAALPGVGAAAGLGQTTVSARAGGRRLDLALFGTDPRGPGAPRRLVRGRPPGPGELVADGADRDRGLGIGDTVTLLPSGIPLRVVGLLDRSRFSAEPTGFTDLGTFDRVLRAANPAAPSLPVNLVAVRAAGPRPAALAGRIGAAVPGTRALTRGDAVARIPGVGAVSQSFGLLVGITFVIVVVVVGFFFLILTVQKTKAFTVLCAVGASRARLAGVVAGQVTVVVLAASVVAVVVLLLAVGVADTGIPVRVEPVRVAATTLAVLAASLLAGLLSVRRIARIDPAAGAR